jgi:hypothetical protein
LRIWALKKLAGATLNQKTFLTYERGDGWQVILNGAYGIVNQFDTIGVIKWYGDRRLGAAVMIPRDWHYSFTPELYGRIVDHLIAQATDVPEAEDLKPIDLYELREYLSQKQGDIAS